MIEPTSFFLTNTQHSVVLIHTFCAKQTPSAMTLGLISMEHLHSRGPTFEKEFCYTRKNITDLFNKTLTQCWKPITALNTNTETAIQPRFGNLEILLWIVHCQNKLSSGYLPMKAGKSSVYKLGLGITSIVLIMYNLPTTKPTFLPILSLEIYSQFFFHIFIKQNWQVY